MATTRRDSTGSFATLTVGVGVAVGLGLAVAAGVGLAVATGANVGVGVAAGAGGWVAAAVGTSVGVAVASAPQAVMNNVSATARASNPASPYSEDRLSNLTANPLEALGCTQLEPIARNYI